MLKNPLKDETEALRGDMPLMRTPCWTAWSTCHALDFRACSPVTAMYDTTAAHSSSALWLSMVPHHSTCSRNKLHPWLIHFFAACHVQYLINITAVVVAAENVFRDYRTSGCRVIKVTQKLVLNSVWRQYQRVIIHLLCLLTLSKGRYKTLCEGVRVLEPLLELILLIYLW